MIYENIEYEMIYENIVEVDTIFEKCNLFLESKQSFIQKI